MVREVVIHVGLDHGGRLVFPLREHLHLHHQRLTDGGLPRFLGRHMSQVLLHGVPIGSENQALAVDQGSIQVEQDGPDVAGRHSSRPTAGPNLARKVEVSVRA